MKASVYAAGTRVNDLRLYLSLDLNVDRYWWGNQPEPNFFRPVSWGMPLQWASRLAGTRLDPRAVAWSESDWSRYIRTCLGRLLSREDPSSIAVRLGIMSEPGVRSEAEDSVYPEARCHPSDREWLQRLAASARRLSTLLEGRSLLGGELESMLKELDPFAEKEWKSAAQLAYLHGRVQLGEAVAAAGDGKSNTHRCLRCGSAAQGVPCGSCGSADCARCEECRALGRSRSCELLLQGTVQTQSGPRRSAAAATPEQLQTKLARWALSPAQTSASERAFRFLEAEPGKTRGKLIGHAGERSKNSATAPRSSLHGITRKLFRWRDALFPATSRPDTPGYAAADPGSRFLLWAVTGAGKTEMLFPLIEQVRGRGGRVLVATPRRDVVLELAPRLRKAFPGESLVALYGGSEERWRTGGVTLATTHQLLRFAHAFDLVVIDELDAFPFHGDPMLAYAAERCRAPGGKTVYLSATPPKELQSLVRKGRLACAKVPVRYHRHPLPVPVLLRTSPLSEYVRKKRLPDALLRRWRASLERGAQVFIFVPKIALAEPLAALLRSNFPGIAVGATSSQDEERGEKVLSFRGADLRMLVTTTILERGVTVPRSDVYILDADSGLFDEASLVQMAGRAGRSADDPAGKVVFAAVEKTRAQAGACRQIRRMNRLARPFLLPQYVRSSWPRRSEPRPGIAASRREGKR